MIEAAVRSGMADVVQHKDMAPNGLAGLPTRPLTRADLRALSSHPSIDICEPVYQLVDDPDAVTSLFLGINDQIHLVLFNPDDEHWEVAESVQEPESLTEEAGINSVSIQRDFETYYDEDEVELTESLDDVDTVLEAFAGNFPNEPLSETQLEKLGERDFIFSAIPFVLQKEDNRAVSVLLVYDHPTEAKRMVGGYGFDPDQERWMLISSVVLQEDREALAEVIGEEMDEWLFSERYSRDQLGMPEEADSWIPSN